MNKKYSWYNFLLVPFFCFLSFIGHAQLIDVDTMRVDSQALKEASKAIDSTFYSTFHPSLDTAILPNYLSENYIDFWTYERIYRENPYLVNLGNAGTAAYELSPSWNRKIGLETGLNAFDVYKFDVDKFVFQASNVSRTYLNYNQAPQQTKSSTRASFGRSLGLKSGIKIDYARTNELGEYDRQRVRHTNIGVGLFVFPSDRLKFVLTTISNNMATQESGGITTDSLFGNATYDDRSVYPVKLSSGGLTDKERTVNLGVHFVPFKQLKKLRFSFINQFSNNIYHYQDGALDTAYYGTFLNHKAGVRVFLKNQQWKHELKSRYHWNSEKNKVLAGHVDFGVSFVRNKLTYDLKGFDINQLVYSANIHQRFSKNIFLDGDVKFVGLDQGGDYETNWRLDYLLNENISLGGHVRLSKSSPYLLYDYLYINDELIYDNNFDATDHQIVSARASYKPYGLTLIAAQKNTTNYLQWTADKKPENIGDASITSISLQWKKNFSALYVENYMTYQNTNSDKIHIPSFFSRHFIAYKFRLFKKNLETNVGAEAFVIPNYNGVAYFAPTTSFFPVDKDTEFSYMVNGLINFRIKSFGISLRFENLSSIWDDDIRYYIQDFPKNDFRFRLGLAWALKD